MYRLISWEFGYKMYFTADANIEDVVIPQYSASRAQAAIFDNDEWEKRPYLWREDLSEAERMERAGVARLPGLEAQP